MISILRKLSIFCSPFKTIYKLVQRTVQNKENIEYYRYNIGLQVCPLFHLHHFVALQTCVHYCNSCTNSYNDITFDGHKFPYIDILNLWW